MNEWNVSIILDLLERCGQTALQYFDAPGVSVKEDRSLVTEADTAIEALLESVFDKPEQGSYLIGEETIASREQSYIDSALHETAWIVDPIDGTAPYAHHLPHWGISIGMAKGGRIEEGAVYLPVTREYYLTDKGKIFFAQPAAGELPELRPLIVQKAPAGEKTMVAITQDLVRNGGYRLRNPVQALGCAVMPLVYLVQGRFMAYMGSLKLWDAAGAIPILRNAGFLLRFAGGGELDDRITSENYALEINAPVPWKMKDTMFAAPSADVLALLDKGIALT